MYNSEERDHYFNRTIENVKSIEFVEGVIQLGSGVIGYNDSYSDIDMMVSAANVENVEKTKDKIRQVLSEFNPIYIKEKQLRKDIYLIIAIMENTLEFNISILPTDLLNVKSPLWKVVIDKTGSVSKKMKFENEKFTSKPITYEVPYDVVFEFVYSAMSLNKELKRKNLIYALKLLEEMRSDTLVVQALNENKKLHQFKAYETLHPSFIKEYLLTFPVDITAEHIKLATEKLIYLFTETVNQSSLFSMDDALKHLIYNKVR
ncbi:aminoglycoside 6-adenylyltransferase [Fredinandcohnia sp. 179-A 10B2 NHS]|uniref:aminoglycoside 6-adenylyltransferase n=1 Tax=Fredinandcohnia sp. 179-A 10B2 NHS TaxID=3235176 RepID=UPI0039A2E930